MHTHPAAGERRRLSLATMVAGYAAAWMVVAPVLAHLAQAGLIARHHLEAYPNYQLRYPPYTRDPKTAVARSPATHELRTHAHGTRRLDLLK